MTENDNRGGNYTSFPIRAGLCPLTLRRRIPDFAWAALILWWTRVHCLWVVSLPDGGTIYSWYEFCPSVDVKRKKVLRAGFRWFLNYIYIYIRCLQAHLADSKTCLIYLPVLVNNRKGTCPHCPEFILKIKIKILCIRCNLSYSKASNPFRAWDACVRACVCEAQNMWSP